MSAISSVEIVEFWRALSHLVEEWRIRFAAAGDWGALVGLQELERSIVEASACDASTIPGIARLENRLRQFSRMGNDIEPLIVFAHQCAQILEIRDENANAEQTALARQLFSMHRFLDGVSGAEQFGALHTVNSDIQYGLGVGLRDGSMLRFLSALSETDQRGNEHVISRCFEEDAPELIEAVQNGQTSLEQYFQSQLILRYDPIMSRKVFQLSDSMQARFARLGTEPLARNAQINILAGNRFSNAKKQASQAGIRSLRGFAMLFDLETLAPAEAVRHIGVIQDESQKCLSLADAVISRMHGYVAAHWQNRLESVFHGEGYVDGRFYDEKRFLGENVAGKNWENAQIALEDELISSEPAEGRIYIVNPGDRLTTLTEKAYRGEGDYRFVLRQNPHILHPESLEPGTRLYFPELHSGKNTELSEGQNVVCDSQNHQITYGGRTISALQPMTDAQMTVFCEGLGRVPVHQLCHTECVELPDGAAVVCLFETLLITDKINEIAASEMFPESGDSLMKWVKLLAAQVRGDVIFRDDCFLPLSSIPSQSHRSSWFATALKRLIQDENAVFPKLIIHARTRCVDIVDAFDETVVRLENEDFLAIRNQPGRRLADYVAPPVVQMNVLSQLWLASVFSVPFEIGVPPLAHVNQYSLDQPDGASQFLVPMGTPVYPIMAGTVADCGRFPGIGYGILIRHHNGLYSRYSCLATICVETGQQVNAATMIARSGCSMLDGHPMLRLELKYSENVVVDWQEFVGKSIEYFDVICHHWPTKTIFESIMVE